MIASISIAFAAALATGEAPQAKPEQEYLLTSCAMRKFDIGTKSIVGKPSLLAFYFSTAPDVDLPKQFNIKDPQNILNGQEVTSVQFFGDAQMRFEAKNKNGEGFELITLKSQGVDPGGFAKVNAIMRYVPEAKHKFRYGGDCLMIFTKDPEAEIAAIFKN